MQKAFLGRCKKSSKMAEMRAFILIAMATDTDDKPQTRCVNLAKNTKITPKLTG